MAELQLIHTASVKQLSCVYASTHGCACSLISKHKLQPYRGVSLPIDGINARNRIWTT